MISSWIAGAGSDDKAGIKDRDVISGLRNSNRIEDAIRARPGRWDA
jgi:hypothetical protein